MVDHRYYYYSHYLYKSKRAATLKERKILFAGLDYGGKTSILLALQRKYSYMNSKPTRGINRKELNSFNFLGFKCSAWDLGGQARFREQYLKQKYRVFLNTEVLFYVIDMQDPERFELSLGYLKDIIDTLEGLNENPKIAILFHKIDPDIVPSKNPEMKSRIDLLKKDIENLNIPFGYEIYETTIHDKATILKAFSEIIFRGENQTRLITERLKVFAKTTFSSAILLLTSDYLEMASHATKKIYLSICEAVGAHFLSAMERVEDYNLTAQNSIVNLKFNENHEGTYYSAHKPNLEELDTDNNDNAEQKDALIFLKSFYVDDLKFHIVSLSRNHRTLKLTEQQLPVLSEQLKNIIKEFR